MSETADPHANCLGDIDIVVLAGGLGTRLAPVVPDSPKILAQVAGRPYLEFLLNWLRSFGARRVILSLGHLADQVEAYLDARESCDMVVDTVIEPDLLGTGGAVGFVRPKIQSPVAMVMNGDSFVDDDLCQFVAAYQNSGAEGAILCTEVDDAARYGTVELDDTSHIKRFLEKDPSRHGPGLINAGVYLFGAAMLDRIAEMEPGSLERDVFEAMSPADMLAVAGHHTFLDIGTPDDWRRAATVLAPYMN